MMAKSRADTTGYEELEDIKFLFTSETSALPRSYVRNTKKGRAKRSTSRVDRRQPWHDSGLACP